MDKTLFDLYTDFLLSSFGQASATNLSRLVDGAISHDQVTRMLAGEPQRSVHLWRKVKPLVRAVESPAGVIIIDDSISEKPSTDENELISWHWDHSQQRAVKGINFLTAFYQVGTVGVPVAFDLVTKTATYRDAKTNKEKRKSVRTSNERMRTLLRVVVHNDVEFSYVLADLWYASADNMKFIHRDLAKHFVLPLKDNRQVAASAADHKQGRFVAVETLALPTGQTRQIWLEDVPFALLLTTEVFTNKDASTGVRYLVSDDLTLTYDQIIKLYQRRWSIEVYHESLKQNASLEKSPTRTQTTQRNHFFASVCAYVKLESLKLKTGVNHFALKSKIYLAALKTAYEELVKLEPISLGA